mmetsp:Transcript_12335/g.20429  ORF Transcript_12335/g.20429 Transcript_12335/m.20429 type:complete len:766 (+) Transcript_12335:125-2422(+)
MSSKTNNTNRTKSAQGSNSKDKPAPAPTPRTAAAADTTTTNTSNAWSKPNNAWSRPLKTGPPPGLSAPSSGGKGGLDPVMRERFLHLTLTLVGQRVTCTQQDGTVLEGVFHTATPFQDLPKDKKNVYVLKAVLVIKGDTDKIPNGSTVVIPANKITSLHCKSIRLGAINNANGKGEAFRTDTEISLTPNDDRRDLVAAGSAWTAAGNSRPDAKMDGGPNAGQPPRKVALRGNIGEWDQFRANEELFSIQAKFDENLYTTELDKSAMDSAKIKQAERMAREIENTTSSNIHVAEERNQAIGGDYDEEDRYSGVLTNNLQVRNKDGAPVPKKMNYAAAAAKADAAKLAPPGFVAGKKEDKATDEKKDSKDSKKKSANGTDETKGEAVSKEALKQSTEEVSKQEEKKTTEVEDSKPAQKESVVKNEEGKNGDSAAKAETEDAKAKEEEKKAPIKLNANAKSFSFNPGAKTFTPSFGTPTPAPAADPQQMIDPNTGAPVPQQVPGQPHYMQHPMGQPGMMPIMNPHFAMQYPRGYPGMEQQPGQPPQHLQQHPHMHQQPQQPHEGAVAPAGGNEQQQTGESANQTPHQPQQQQQPQPPPQHPGVPVPYPPNASPYHYAGGMPMHQRGPGVPHMAYPPQMVGQQIPVVPGRNPYQMYGMPPPPPMRGPNGAPYYPNAAPHYPQYMVGEDDYRGGGRGRGSGRRGGRGGRKGGRGGRGGYGYQHNPRDQGMHNGGGGRHAPHTNAPSAEEQSPAVETAPPVASKEEPSSVE